MLERTRAPKEVDWCVPHRLEKGMSVSEDARPQRGVDCEIPHRLGEENEAFFIRVWKLLPRQCAGKDTGLEGGGLGGPTSIGEGNECR